MLCANCQDWTGVTVFRRACPNCGQRSEGDPYDVGSGPELACPGCEWCWGAIGQPLVPLPPTPVPWPGPSWRLDLGHVGPDVT